MHSMQPLGQNKLPSSSICYFLFGYCIYVELELKNFLILPDVINVWSLKQISTNKTYRSSPTAVS